MRRNLRLVGWVLGAGVGAWLASCSDTSGPTPPPPVGSVTIAPESISIHPGNTAQLTATILDADGHPLQGRSLTWASGNPAVAMISPAGLVSAVGVGRDTVTATSEGKQDTAIVSVMPQGVASVTVTPDTATIVAGHTLQLAAILVDSAGSTVSGRAVTWETKTVAVATVTSTGLVTAVAPGLDTITATSEGQADTAVITVAPEAAISPPLIVSDPAKAATVAQAASSGAVAEALEDSVAYVSLSPGSVPLGQTAVVRRIGSTSTLTTVVANGGFDPVPVGAVAGDSIDVAVTDAGGRIVFESQLRVKATRPPVVVRSDPPGRRTDVPLNTLVVIVLSEPIDSATLSSGVRLFNGTTPVFGTVRLDPGELTAIFAPSAPLDANTSYRLEVSQAIRDQDGEPLEAAVSAEFMTGTKLEGPAALVAVFPERTVVEVGSQVQLTAIARDAQGLVLTGRLVAWSATPPVASVSSTGLVTALAEGQDTIVATVEGVSGGALVDVVSVGSMAPVESVTVLPETATVDIGSTLVLAATTKDSTGRLLSFRPVTWVSGDAAIASVQPTSSTSPDTSKALVSGIAAGSTTITATSEGRSAMARIRVVAPGTGAVASVIVTPDSAYLPTGQTLLLTVTLRDSTGGLLAGRIVTWGSSDSSVAQVTSTGQVTSVAAGLATIIATSEGTSGTSAITVQRSVGAGQGHSCASTPNGDAICWGANAYGELGTGTLGGNDSQPVVVTGGHAFASLQVGNTHTCGLTPAGSAYCWGSNRYGQMGSGSAVVGGVPTPTAVVGGYSFLTMSLGGFHSCGLTSEGAAYCWGSNLYGKLGTGSTSGPELCDASTPCSTSPVLVAGGAVFGTISAGYEHTCALIPTGAAYCWGDNYYGQLGTGSRDTIPHPTPVLVVGGRSFVTVSAGEQHTCGLTAAGAAFCWGDNTFGQLGAGASEPGGGGPVAVVGGHVFVALTADGYFTCGITASGTAYCWGINGSGQLGEGSTTDSPVPVQVAGGLTFAVLSAGWDHACGRTIDGTLYCWGDNVYGELGDGSTQDSWVPVKVAGQP